jgi:hypothetical protein
MLRMEESQLPRALLQYEPIEQRNVGRLKNRLMTSLEEETGQKCLTPEEDDDDIMTMLQL